MNRPTAADARVAKAVQMGDRNWVAQQSAIESLPTAARGAARGETHQPAAELTQVPASLSERTRGMAVAHASLSSDLGARRHERPMEDDRVAVPNRCTSRRCGFDSPNLGNRETR